MAYLPVEDFGNPKVFSAVAKSGLTAGQFVFCSGADNVVNASGVSVLVTGDIQVAPTASGAQVVGVAIAAASSGGLVPVQTAGLIVCVANGTVTASFPVSVDGNDAVANAGSVAANLASLRNIGRALTSAASGGYCVVNLNL